MTSAAVLLNEISVLAGRDAPGALEMAIQMALIGESATEGDIGECLTRIEQALCFTNLALDQVGVRR